MIFLVFFNSNVEGKDISVFILPFKLADQFFGFSIPEGILLIDDISHPRLDEREEGVIVTHLVAHHVSHECTLAIPLVNTLVELISSF